MSERNVDKEHLQHESLTTFLHPFLLTKLLCSTMFDIDPFAATLYTQMGNIQQLSKSIYLQIDPYASKGFKEKGEI